ncbi:MAG: molybdopterin molybdotransferase MoeA, partial [Haloferacaceae archaeon]
MTEDYADLVDRETARAAVRDLREALVGRLGTERVAVGDAGGRTLAEPVVADADAPPRDFATMDGFALAAGDGYPLTVVGSVYPEDDPPSLAPGEAVRIATGAPLPERADAVLRREDAETTEEGGVERLRGPPLDPGTYVHERGTNVAAGETLFEAGEVLAPRDALLLGDLGRETVPVLERPSVGLLATGTEIHEGRRRDLDSPMLANLLRSWGGRPTHEGSVPDDFERTRDRVAALADAHDVVVTTGGTSVGDKDQAVRALRDL